MAKGVASYLGTVALGQPVLKFNDLLSEIVRYWKLLEIQIKPELEIRKIAIINTHQIMNFENC